MKRKSLILFGYILTAMLIIGLVAVFALPLLKWHRLPETPMDIWVVDKTVPNPDRREHNGLFWILENKKMVNKQTGQAFHPQTDYYGFFPIDAEHYVTKELPTETQYPDLIYLADTYGVYKDDYLSTNVAGTRSELMYGGLSGNEFASIQANLGGGNTIVGEFNTASSPTNIANRQQLGQVFHGTWTGWSGRYFKDLTQGVEVPIWAIEDYEAQTDQKWNFTGEGMILVSDDTRIVVLQNGKEIGKDDIYLFFESAYQTEFGIENDIPYDYWFEWTLPDASAEIIASFHLDLTETGKAALEELGLPETFPAIVRSKNTQYTSYYFAGDFADSNSVGNWSHFSGYATWKKWFTFGTKGDNSTFYWRCYVPLMGKILDDSKLQQNKTNNDAPFTELSYTVRANGTQFELLRNGQWERFFSKGVNIGASTPGNWFTQFSHDEGMYLRWFKLIAEMNANTIRVYTLMSPQFYQALEHYNKSHSEAPLWLYQEVWPDENPPSGEYLNEEYNLAYQAEIKNVIDAIHGQANIPARIGRAYGIYTSDVSSYVVGYLVGRELEPEEVIQTNEENPNFSYSGEYLYCEDSASPTEAWLAQSCDYLLTYEASEYGWQHMVGVVSWPTLDPREHDSEWNIAGNKMLEYNDKVSVDINHISTNSNLKTGFFGAYHIYPNYPDFMNHEASYAEYQDSEGVFRYGGYLREFIAGHTKYPALVAEFGLATGMGNAHSNPDGYNHGGLTETEQGQGIVRMMKAIQQEGYTGGLIFEWSDEWAKKTWTTEPYIIPFERNVIWHSAVDPEQNYGILSVESTETKSEPYAIKGNGPIGTISLTADETYLWIEVDLTRKIDFSKETMVIGLDTYNRKNGNLNYGNQRSEQAPSGMEFVIQINGQEQAQLLAKSGYNVTKGGYASQDISENGTYETMSTLINKERITKSGEVIPAIYTDESRLRYGSLEKNSYSNWIIDGNRIQLRLPWNRINFTDPSNMRVLDDIRSIPTPQKDELATTITDGILVSGIVVDRETNWTTGKIGTANDQPFRWNNWDVPAYQEREKDSYAIIGEYFSTIK